MENRFGIKDFFLFLLVVALLVSVWLAMKQYDRQWEQLQAINGRLEGQARDLRDIRSSLAGGVALVAPGTTTQASSTRPTVDPNDPFGRIKLAEAKPDYSRGDWLVDVFPGQVAKLTPLLSGDAYASEVQGHVLDSLAARDPETLQWQPLLAESWKMTDESAKWREYADARKKIPLTEAEIADEPDYPPAEKPDDRKAYTERRMKEGRRDEDVGREKDTPPAVLIDFTLRDNLTFSDGEPLTVKDVLFTYNFIMNPAIAAPRDRSALERVRRVEKIGPRTVRFVFTEPYFQAFLLAASFQVMPEHFYGKFKPEDFNQSVGLLLGSGPYRMIDPTSWKPGTPIQLVRNDRYWGVAPAFDKLVWREISGDKGRLASFRNGEVDQFPAQPEQYRELLKDESLMTRVHRFEYQNPAGGYRYIAWNEKNPLFADKRVRQALTMLTDRQRIIDEISLGYGVIATGPFNPQSRQCDPAVKPWPYDVSAATKQLADAGFKTRNADGVLVSADGRPFEFKLTYPAGNASYDKMILFIKDSYARAGIVLKPDPLEWAVFTDRLNNKNFEAICLGWTSGIENDIFQMFHSSQAIAGGDNFMSYLSPEFDAACNAARATMDEDARMALWRKAHAVLHEDQPYTFLSYGKSLVFIDSRIDNVQRIKLGLNPTDEWFVPAGKQRYKD